MREQCHPVAHGRAMALRDDTRRCSRNNRSLLGASRWRYACVSRTRAGWLQSRGTSAYRTRCVRRNATAGFWLPARGALVGPGQPLRQPVGCFVTESIRRTASWLSVCLAVAAAAPASGGRRPSLRSGSCGQRWFLRIGERSRRSGGIQKVQMRLLILLIRGVTIKRSGSRSCAHQTDHRGTCAQSTGRNNLPAASQQVLHEWSTGFPQYWSPSVACP